MTKVRRELEKTKVKRTKRGRPTTKEDKATIRKNGQILAKITALFENRYFVVQKELTLKERETLHEITRGLPQLRQLREIMDEVYRLYDRRCKAQTALEKLRKLRERVNRRHRKMQKTVYRVRTHRHIINRIAMNMFRDRRLTGRMLATESLYVAKNKQNVLTL